MPTRFLLERLGQQTPVGETNLPSIVQKVVDLKLHAGKRGLSDRALRLGTSIRVARGRQATTEQIDAAVKLGESIAASLRSVPEHERPSLVTQFIPEND